MGGKGTGNDIVGDVTMSFLEVVVSEGGNNTGTLGLKQFTDVAIEASSGSKELYVGSHYKVKWKYVSSLECWEDGFLLQMYGTNHQNRTGGDYPDVADDEGDGRSFEVRGPIHRRGSTSWESFQTVLQGRFRKEERKRQRRIEEEKEREEKKKREGRFSTIGRKRRQTYSKRPLDFMKRNAANISFNVSSSSPTTAHFDFDSDGDDQVFQQYMSRKERGTNHQESRKRNRPNEEEDDMMRQNQPQNDGDDASEGDGSQPDEGGTDIVATEFDDMDGHGDYTTSVAAVDASSDRDDIDQATDKAGNDSDGDDAPNDDMGLPTSTNTTTRKQTNKTGRRLRRLKKRTPVLEEDSDDDDDLFGGPRLTTPAVQRIVSPWTSTGEGFDQNPIAVEAMKDGEATKNSGAKGNESVAKEIDSDATPSLEGEDSEKLPKDGPTVKVTPRPMPKQSIASYFAPARSQDDKDATGSKLNDIDPSNIPSKNITEVYDEMQDQADMEEDTGGSKDEIDESNGITDGRLRDTSKSQKSDHAMVARKIIEKSNTSAQSFFNPRPKRINNSHSYISPPRSKEGDETDGDSTVVLNATPTPGSKYADVGMTHDDEKSGRKRKQSITPTKNANLSTPVCLFSKNFDIVRKSAQKIEEEDPIDEIDSSQSPQPKTPSGWRSRKLGIRPRSRLGKTYMSSQKAFRALELADARTQLHGSAKIITTERSPMSAFKSPHKQSPLMPKRIGLSPRNDDIVTKTSSPVVEPRPQWRGLRNNGNTCYINASLQMLFSVPRFMRAIRGLQENHRLVKNLVSLWNDLSDTQWSGAATAKGVKDAMDDLTDRFLGFQQRDAHEFLGELIDMVHEELLDTEKKVTHGNSADEDKKGHSISTVTETSPVNVFNKKEPTDEFFRLDVQVCLQCKSCGYSR